MDRPLEDSTEKYLNLTRMALFEIIKESGRRKFEEKFAYLESHLVNITKCPEKKRRDLRHQLSRFETQFKLRWTAARSTGKAFIKKNKEWLAGTVTTPIFTPGKGGRPAKSFQESSERTKRRKTEGLRQDKSPEELSFAAQMTLRKTGQVDAASVIKDITTTTPTRASKYKESFKKTFTKT